MRFSAAYYLLLLYTTVVLRAALPLVSDMLSHEFEEQIHLATIHAKYGANHLESQLANTATESKDENTLKTPDAAPVHLLVAYEKNIHRFISKQTPFEILAGDHLPLMHIAALTPPPKHLV